MRFLGAGGKMGFGRAGKYENIYVGGLFLSANYENQIGFVPTNRVAKWNGNSPSALGTGLNNNPFTLIMDSSDNVYVGGGFTTANGVTVNRIAKWNGTQWSGFGTGMNNAVNSFAFD